MNISKPNNDGAAAVAAWVAAFGAMSEAALLVGSDGRINATSLGADQLLAAGARPLAGKRLADLVAEPAAEVDARLRTWARTRSWTPAGLVFHTVDGDEVHRAEGARFQFGGAEPLVSIRLLPKSRALQLFTFLDERVANLNDEVSARDRAESLLKDQGQVLRMIGLGKPVSQTLNGIVELMEHWTEDAIGSILWLDEGGHLRVGAAPNLPAAYNEAIDGVAIGPRVGSCGTAAFTGKPVKVADIASDPLWEDYRDLALAHGLRACWSYPIVSSAGVVLGSAAMYYGTPRSPGSLDEEITGVACDLAAIAIERWQTEKVLRKRAEQLAEEHRRKDEFLAMLAHELRNPLSAARAALEVLRTTDRAAEEWEQQLPVLERQTAQLARLVNDLLDVARITRGTIDLRSEPVDLKQLLQHLAQALRPVAEAQAVQLRLVTPATPVWVQGDPDRLLQVFDNLVNNSLKFTPSQGHIEIALDTIAGQARVTVTDDGAGMDPASLPAMFNLFAQGQHSLERKRGGLGIGLTMVKTLVERHGGEVDGRSEGIGRGSQFEVRLPVTDVRVAAPASEAHPGMADLTGLRILLVEDNADSAAALGKLLGLWGHECRIAEDGVAALEAAAQFNPRVILMDIGLPRLDGYEVMRRLRADGRGGSGEIYAIALTGYGQPSDRLRAIDSGFDRHLTKPIDPPRLRQILNEVAAA